jgi:sugar phosphate permease
MTPEIDEDRLYRKVSGRLVPLFFLGFVFSYLDRVNISLARLPMQHDFGLSDHAFSIGCVRCLAICYCSVSGHARGLAASWSPGDWSAC